MSLSYTPLRHKMLAAVALGDGDTQVFWSRGFGYEPDSYDRWRPRLTGAEKRTVGKLAEARLVRQAQPGASVYKARPLSLTEGGRSRLEAWNGQYGEPK